MAWRAGPPSPVYPALPVPATVWMIPLASIRAFKHFLPGSPAIYILYGSASTYVPNGALDPKELVNLLHAHGVKEESP